MTEFVGLRAKTYSYLADDGSEDKKAKDTKIQQRFKIERHNVFTEEINKTALSSNDDKRMQSTDSLDTYAYGTSKDLVRKKEEIKCNNITKQYKK